jgi:tungstate transport system ATP-binding protein
MSLIELREVSFRRGDALVLDVAALAVAAGETLAVVGPNGAGKTTLLMVLAQLWRPGAGEVLLRGAPLRTRRDRFALRRQLAMVFDEPLLFEGTVERNVGAGLRFRGCARDERAARIDESLQRFRIAHLRRRDTRALSLGEAQRVSLARAFALQPALLLLDEPLHALDPISREALLADLAHNLHGSGITTVFTTHNLDEARRLADRLAVLRAGRPVQLGTPAEVMHRPADREVAAFVGMENLWPARVLRSSPDGIVAEVGATEIAAAAATEIAAAAATEIAAAAATEIAAAAATPPGSAVTLGVRPEQVRVARAAAPDAGNVLPGRVARLSPRGACTAIQLDCAIPLVALALDGDPAVAGLAAGDAVVASFPPAAVHLMPAGNP